MAVNDRKIFVHDGFSCSEPLPDLSGMSEMELSEELEKGYADMKAGRTKPAAVVFDSIRKDYEV